MEHFNYLLDSLKMNAKEILDFFEAGMGPKQWGVAAIAIVLAMLRQGKLLVFYLYLFFYAWGLKREFARVDMENSFSWANMGVYVIFGLITLGIMCYWVFIKKPEPKS